MFVFAMLSDWDIQTDGFFLLVFQWVSKNPPVVGGSRKSVCLCFI